MYKYHELYLVANSFFKLAEFLSHKERLQYEISKIKQELISLSEEIEILLNTEIRPESTDEFFYDKKNNPTTWKTKIWSALQPSRSVQTLTPAQRDEYNKLGNELLNRRNALFKQLRAKKLELKNNEFQEEI